MKIINEIVDVVALFSVNLDYPRPIKMRYKVKDEGNKIVNIDKIVDFYKDKRKGETFWIFHCESNKVVNNEFIAFDLHYDKEIGRWFLHCIY